MPKLSIDIGVNLGYATQQLGKLNGALISLNSNAQKLVETLKTVGKINIKPTVGMGTSGTADPQATPKQVPSVYEQYIQEANSAATITQVFEQRLEELVQRSAVLKAELANMPSFDVDGFETTSAELKKVENQIKQLQGILKSQSLNISAPKNVPDIFKEFRSGASGAATAIDFLRQREQELIAQSNALRASLSTNISAGGFQDIVRDIKQVEDELKKVQSLLGLQPPDIFADFKSGAIQASTALEFLEIKQQELIQESLRLKSALKTAGTGEEFSKLQNELNKTEKELNDVTRAIQSQKGPVGGAAGAYGNLTKTTNLANLSVVNFGRVLQDLPFGILGIANNLNPLIEGLRDLSVEAKTNGTTLKKELFNSLKGFGGLTLAISGVSAALSFASIGLSYWTRDLTKARDEQEKFNDGLAKAQAKAYETGRVLSDLVAEGSKYTNGSIEQTRVINKINGLLDENTQKINQNSFANGEATRITKGFTEALIARGAAEFALAKAGEAGAKLRILQNRQLKLSETEGVLAAGKALDAAQQFSGVATVGAPIFNWLQSTFGSDVGKKAQEYKDNVKEIAELTKVVGNFGEIYDQAQAEFKASSDSIAENSRYKELTDEIKGFEDQQKNLTGTYKEQRAEYDRLNNEIKIRREELDQILGKEKDAAKKRDGQKTTAQKVADLYKEINADLLKIESRRDLNPLEKATESAKVLESGLDNILDLDIKQLNVNKFKKLEDTLKGFESKKIGLEIDLITTNLDKDLNRLDERGRILNIDVSKDKLKLFETAIDALFDKYDDTSISLLDKQNVLSTIGILQGAIRQLNLNNLVKSGENAFKDLTIDVEKLNQRKILLGVSIGKEGLALAKKTIDTINEKKIELLSEKDPARAAQLNDEIKEAEGIFSQFRSVAISESFKEYENAAIRINEEFQRTSQFLRSDKKLEFKIETDKQRLNLVSKEIDDELKLGISPLDPRIIFGKILQTKLKLQIEADTEALKLLQEQAELVRDTLEETFSGIGEAIGTALAEGGNVAKAVGKSVLETLGGFLQQLGKQFIAASKLIQTAQTLLGTGGGVLAGIALVALGALIKGFASTGFAEGGFVSGPGSERSDSIPARLSNGEFVVQAKSVRKYGRGFMEMLNNGNMPISNYKKNFGDLRFADGGLVTRDMSRAIVNRSDIGVPDMGGFVAETRISGQDLKLVLKRADTNYSKTT